MPTNFTACQASWANATAQEIEQYGWRGLVAHVPKNDTTQISLEGCLHFCGDRSDWYPWTQEANTMTTWVLPIVGILLQAPFVSNAFWETVFSLARWIGSPMASLAYILWNIKVTGKCAMIVDMAVPYNDKDSVDALDFASIRDSFYLLMTMNQYTMRSKIRQKKEAEGLLRMVLFSKDLRLLKEASTERREGQDLFPSNIDWDSPTPFASGPSAALRSTAEQDLEEAGYLDKRRNNLAAEMRAARRRGVVPVFISTMWFLFSLGLSIQAAFGFLGENAQAHDLALGLLLAWLPVLILSSIVDRNPVAAEDIKNKLNELVDQVRRSLMDDVVCAKYLDTITDHGARSSMRKWVEEIRVACPDLNDFYVRFAGQARLRYHYGAAHPILTDIERAYIANEGRDWLHAETEARVKLVLGDVQEGGLDWLDLRELWQVLSAVLIVGGSILGAFVLSFFTPTVGLGCRSGGYMIFGMISFILLLVEMFSWWVFDATKPKWPTNTRRPAVVNFLTSGWQNFTRGYMSAAQALSDFANNLVEVCRSILRSTLERIGLSQLAVRADRKLENLWDAWREATAPGRLDLLFFKPVELFNSAWLVYIVLAQTIGSYNKCSCKASNWAGGGGYVDFGNFDTSSSFIRLSWTSATVISTTFMACGLIYIVTEWCLQSHLSTGDMHSSARGLRMTRRFRWLTSPYRDTMHAAIAAGYMLRLLIFHILRAIGLLKRQPAPPSHTRRSLVWSSKITCKNAVHDHDRNGQELASPARSRAGSNVPLFQGQGPDGSPLAIDTSSERVHTDQTPRSSDDGDLSDAGSPMSLRVPGIRPTFERQAT